MPLPAENTKWPPANLQPVTERLAAWSAWYSGNPDDLEYAYGNGMGSGFDTTSNNRIKDRPSQLRGGVVGRFARWFWGEPLSSNQKRSKLHVPLASDIAVASADLLFSEPPTITVPDDKDKATQERLDALIDQGMYARLTEAAEVCAGLGGVYLRTCWDVALYDKPWLSAIHADAAIPEWQWDRLSAVTFWRVLSADDKEVVRHLERHERGHILHAVYKGTSDGLGARVPLTDFPETVDLQEDAETGIDQLTATYIPNMRPNRLWRNLPPAAPLGRADISGSEPLLDALDETYSSWMRDVRNGKGRMVVPETYLESLGTGRGARFDVEREVWESLNMLGRADSSNLANSLQVVQFQIRVAEHRDTAQDLIEQILRGSGYSPQTFGLHGEVAITATEVQAKNRKSFLTRDKKINYWQEGLRDALETLLAIDQKIFSSGVTPQRPDIEFGDSVSESPQALAQTAQLLRAAEAASTETLVQLVHPDWDDPRVQEEVARISAEQQGAMSAPGLGFEAGMGPEAGPGASDPLADLGETLT
jgi:A118 family predicted phage portal protein